MIAPNGIQRIEPKAVDDAGDECGHRAIRNEHQESDGKHEPEFHVAQKLDSLPCLEVSISHAGVVGSESGNSDIPFSGFNPRKRIGSGGIKNRITTDHSIVMTPATMYMYLHGERDPVMCPRPY